MSTGVRRRRDRTPAGPPRSWSPARAATANREVRAVFGRRIGVGSCSRARLARGTWRRAGEVARREEPFEPGREGVPGLDGVDRPPHWVRREQRRDPIREGRVELRPLSGRIRPWIGALVGVRERRAAGEEFVSYGAERE